MWARIMPEGAEGDTGSTLSGDSISGKGDRLSLLGLLLGGRGVSSHILRQHIFVSCVAKPCSTGKVGAKLQERAIPCRGLSGEHCSKCEAAIALRRIPMHR